MLTGQADTGGGKVEKCLFQAFGVSLPSAFHACGVALHFERFMR